MGRRGSKLHYVKGTCELEKGVVSFIGGMNGVSSAQAWYHVIYAIKDRFREIDFWIRPDMEECITLSSTMNHLRYGICKDFRCTYEPFKNGEIRPKLKLSEFDKNKYRENRAKAYLGVDVALVNTLPVFEYSEELPVFETHLFNTQEEIAKALDSDESIINHKSIYEIALDNEDTASDLECIVEITPYRYEYKLFTGYIIDKDKIDRNKVMIGNLLVHIKHNEYINTSYISRYSDRLKVFIDEIIEEKENKEICNAGLMSKYLDVYEEVKEVCEVRIDGLNHTPNGRRLNDTLVKLSNVCDIYIKTVNELFKLERARLYDGVENETNFNDNFLEMSRKIISSIVELRGLVKEKDKLPKLTNYKSYLSKQKELISSIELYVLAYGKNTKLNLIAERNQYSYLKHECTATIEYLQNCTETYGIVYPNYFIALEDIIVKSDFMINELNQVEERWNIFFR